VLTRHGIVLLVGGVAALVVARVFAVLELFVIGAACFAAAAIAVVYVRVRLPRVEAARWVHPSVLVAGDTGRVDLHLHHRGRLRSAAFVLCEHVQRSTDHTPREARLRVDPMSRDLRTSTGYPLPSAARGVILLGPLDVELRDPLGIARSTRTVAGVDEVVVAPRAYLLEMPRLGQGMLGNALLDKARRLGPGEFHGLREYADGDEPRNIHWRASARTDSLMVKEHTVEGLHRCTVTFDADPASYSTTDAFELGITAAASVVHSAARAGLSTRFVTAGGVDLRGPDVGANTLRVLARIAPSTSAPAVLDRDTGDGLGLVVVVTGNAATPAWRSTQSMMDPTLTPLLITTDDHGRSRQGLSISARSEPQFIAAWQLLTGRGRLDLVER
jgi:uncharacterized protein (DUF58 family)